MNNFFVTKNGTFIKCCWSGIDERKMEQIVADMQKKEPYAEFKLYNWDGETIKAQDIANIASWCHSCGEHGLKIDIKI